MIQRIIVFISIIALCSQRVHSAAFDSLFNEICSLVDTNFYDSTFGGVPWTSLKQKYKTSASNASTQASFARTVNKMLSELKASHTYYYTPDDPLYYQLADIFSAVPSYKPSLCKAFSDCVVKYTDIGIITQQMDSLFFVKAVLDSSPAQNAGILKGDRIISVDNMPYRSISAFKNKANTNIKVTIQRTADKSSVMPFVVKPEESIPGDMFEKAMRKSARMISFNGIDVGYVHVWSFAGERYYEVLKEIVAMEFSNAKALVVDLRYGPGGANPEYLNLFNDRVPVLVNKTRDGQGWTYDPQWRKRVVLLVNEDTRSGKEILAYGFKKYKYGKIVGTRTSGAVLGARPYYLSDGSMLYLAAVKCLVDGELLEGKGVAPDIEITQDIQYCNGKDLQFDKAIGIASQGLK